MKKYYLSIITIALFAVGFAASDEEDSANNTNQEQKQEIKEEKQEKKEDSFLGTYEVTDKVGCTMRITLNEDETATITGVRGENVTYYCSWRDASWQDRGVEINFSDEKPYIVYEGGADENKYEELYIKDGWLYSGFRNVDSKNPKWRLKAKKIK